MDTIPYRVSASTRINDRGLQKPNEDHILIDDLHHIFIILDGITRVHDEYIDFPGESAASDVNCIFSEAVRSYILMHKDEFDPQSLLRNAAIVGNQAIIPYRNRRSKSQWQFFPGTLGIISLIQKQQFHYLYVGDCQGTVIRQGAKFHFGKQGQTEALELMRISKAERYDRYCNHPTEPLGYGIFNGDVEAVELFEQSSFELQPGDTVMLATDGLSRHIQYARSADLINQTPEQIIENSCIWDCPPFAKYADDKALIKLEF